MVNMCANKKTLLRDLAVSEKALSSVFFFVRFVLWECFGSQCMVLLAVLFNVSSAKHAAMSENQRINQL